MGSNARVIRRTTVTVATHAATHRGMLRYPARSPAPTPESRHAAAASRHPAARSRPLHRAERRDLDGYMKAPKSSVNACASAACAPRGFPPKSATRTTASPVYYMHGGKGCHTTAQCIKPPITPRIHGPPQARATFHTLCTDHTALIRTLARTRALSRSWPRR